MSFPYIFAISGPYATDHSHIHICPPLIFTPQMVRISIRPTCEVTNSLVGKGGKTIQNAEFIVDRSHLLASYLYLLDVVPFRLDVSCAGYVSSHCAGKLSGA